MEKLWSVAKSYYLKYMLMLEASMTNELFDNTILRSFEVIEANTVENLCHSNRAYVAELLWNNQ